MVQEMNYEEMTDQELSARLTCALEGKVFEGLQNSSYIGIYNGKICMYPLTLDINSWATIGPLIRSYKVDIEWCDNYYGDIGQCTLFVDSSTDIITKFSDNDKALRSAAITILQYLGTS